MSPVLHDPRHVPVTVDPMKKLCCGKEAGHTPKIVLIAFAEGRWLGVRDKQASIRCWKQLE